MFDARTVLQFVDSVANDERGASALRLLIGTYLLGKMINNGGLKEDKVRASIEYADLLIEDSGILIDSNASDRE